MHDFLTVGAAAPLQEGAAFALGFPDEYYHQLQASYLQKRDFMTALLRDVGFEVFVPNGTYYIMTDAAELMERHGKEDDLQFARWMIDDLGVATVPGGSFYRNKEDGRTKIRFCYCKRQETLDLAVELLAPLRSSAV